jgi:hypothetical protein
MAEARFLVAPPTRTLLPYGLMSVVQTPTDPDDHWQNGILYQTDPCGQAQVTTTDCPVPPTDKLPTLGPGLRGANPFTVYTFPTCSAPGGFAEEARTRAVAALTSGEARTVERVFWTGESGVVPSLAATGGMITGLGGSLDQSAATIITGGPLTPVEGLALLEEALSSCYGNEGVIHVTPGTLTRLVTNGSVSRDGARLRSPNGHLVAAGAGYPGTGPSGVANAPGVRWMFATGAVFLRRTDVITPSATVADSLNRGKNTIGFLAERTYVIGWDCCHFAIPVQIAEVG